MANLNYGFVEKQTQFRAPLWAAVDRMLGSHRGHRTVMYLDTGQGHETRHLLSLGYAARNLLAVNRSPAEMAVLTRQLKRDGYEPVHVAGRDFFDVAWDGGRAFDVLSFDGTGNLSNSAFDNGLLNAIWATTPKVVTFTLLVGREQPEEAKLIRDVIDSKQRFAINQTAHTSLSLHAHDRHFERCRLALIQMLGCCYSDEFSCLWHPNQLFWGTYRSVSHQTMAWCVVAISPHRKPKRTPARLRRQGIWATCEDMRPGERFGDPGPCPVWSNAQAVACGYTIEELSAARSQYPQVTRAAR